MHLDDQTIFALSSGRPPSAISLVRISGPLAGVIVTQLAGRLPAPRRATRALLRDANQRTIDDAVVLWFPAPASATGEDVAEFHVHGGRAILAALFDALKMFADARPAEPGEFTRRAFENGKLDLTEAEGLDDLIHADTEQQRRQAVRQLTGLLGDKARSWRQKIIEAAALVEAGIDFSDEGDVPRELVHTAREKIGVLLRELEEVLAAQGRSERLRDGIVVAIAGPPNAGKSTLINQFARRDVAIVSPHAGTTRDVIEVQLDLGGYPVTVIDTAGIRETSDPIELEGVRRAKARAAEADLVLWIAEDEIAPPPLPNSAAETWWIRNKIDRAEIYGEKAKALLAAFGQKQNDGSPAVRDVRRFSISAQRGDGLDGLLASIVDFAAAYFYAGTEAALITRDRHRVLLQEAAKNLRASLLATDEAEEFVAEYLRGASLALGRLLGRVDVEDVLGSIFSTFCIGK